MLFLIFVISTTLELMLLIEVGGKIGTGNTTAYDPKKLRLFIWEKK